MTDVDWTPIDPAHRDRLAELYGAGITQDIVNSLAVSFPAEGVKSEAKDGVYVVKYADTFDALRAAVLERNAAHLRAKDADENYRLELRAAYRAGATASELHEVVGGSLARVHQLVAGARK